jgi:hypothetical protein
MHLSEAGTFMKVNDTIETKVESHAVILIETINANKA